MSSSASSCVTLTAASGDVACMITLTVYVHTRPVCVGDTSSKLLDCQMDAQNRQKIASTRECCRSSTQDSASHPASMVDSVDRSQNVTLCATCNLLLSGMSATESAEAGTRQQIRSKVSKCQQR